LIKKFLPSRQKNNNNINPSWSGYEMAFLESVIGKNV
jgi:hypothetical protein